MIWNSDMLEDFDRFVKAADAYLAQFSPNDATANSKGDGMSFEQIGDADADYLVETFNCKAVKVYKGLLYGADQEKLETYIWEV